eukprot:jgi/Chrpa1/3178/Chrysochromulina_OHIO_Genome00015548-RA
MPNAAKYLAELTLPPTLKLGKGSSLPNIAMEGGAPFATLANDWAHALDMSAASLPQSTVAERVETVYTLVGEAQARRIIAGRRAAVQQPEPLDGGAARLRGALAACCAALRVDRIASGEEPLVTLARLRAAAESIGAAESNATANVCPAEVAAAQPTSTLEALVSAASAAALSAEERAVLAQVADGLQRDYATRREMLLKRLDVLIQTFGWSERAKARTDEMAAAVAKARAALPPPLVISVESALRADRSLLELQRAPSLSCADFVKKVRIGNVPDRGGRVSAQMPVAPQTYRYMEQERAAGAAAAAARAARAARREAAARAEAAEAEQADVEVVEAEEEAEEAAEEAAAAAAVMRVERQASGL